MKILILAIKVGTFSLFLLLVHLGLYIILVIIKKFIGLVVLSCREVIPLENGIIL
jgi:hypothetical protein